MSEISPSVVNAAICTLDKSGLEQVTVNGVIYAGTNYSTWGDAIKTDADVIVMQQQNLPSALTGVAKTVILDRVTARNLTGRALTTVSGEHVIISGSEFSNNSFTSNSGVYNGSSGTRLTLCGSTFTDTDGEIKVLGNIFAGNSVTGTGTGGVMRAYDADISETSFLNNTAENNGGAIYLLGTRNIIGNNTVFSGNSSAKNGGAVYVYQGITEITGNVKFTTINDSIHLRTGAKLEIHDAVLTLNAKITIEGTASVSVKNSAILFDNDEVINKIGALGIESGTSMTFAGNLVKFTDQDLSKVAISVTGTRENGETIADGVTGIGAFTLTDKTMMLTLNADNKLVVSKMAETALASGTVNGTGTNLITGGRADTFIANRTSSAGQLLTTVNGGSIDKNLIGGAFAKAEDGKAEIVNTELNIGGEADVKGQVYAGGYFYGTGTASTEEQMTVGSVNIALDGESKVNGNLFAGIHARQNANVKVDDVLITVNGGEHDRVYAGGWAEGNSYSEVGKSTITVDGGKVNFIYGGGANGQGKTYVGATTITVGANAEVGTIFMSGRYGYSEVGTVELNWYGTSDMKRLSGVSSAGVDNADSTTVNLLADMNVNTVDYVDMFVFSEGKKLIVNDEFLLGNRNADGTANGATVFDFHTDGFDGAWDAIAGISDFTNAQFAINGGEAVAWDGESALAIGDYKLSYNKDEKLITLAQA